MKKIPPRQHYENDTRILENYKARVASLTLAVAENPTPESKAKLAEQIQLMKNCENRITKACKEILNEEGVENAPVIPSSLISIKDLKNRMRQDLLKGYITQQVLEYHCSRH